MKVIELKNIHECHDLLHSDPYFFPNELVFLNVSEDIPGKIFEDIKKDISGRTSSLIIKQYLSSINFEQEHQEKTCAIIEEKDLISLNKYPQEKLMDLDSIEIVPSTNNLIQFFNLFANEKSLFYHMKRVLINPELLNLSNDIVELTKLLKCLNRINVYFSPQHQDSELWELKTKNRARGPRYIDIDVSNTCGHNCVFCGLYNSDSVKALKVKAKDEPELLNIFKYKIDKKTFSNIIHSLPDSVERITLGGAGEPFTHPDILFLIQEIRKLNINITIFSHFASMTEDLIEQISGLAEKHNPNSIEFIVNISGATEETYIRTRPNQSKDTFKKVLDHIHYATSLYESNSKGISIILMSVTNKLNYKEMPLFVALSKKLKANKLWIKPMELHGEFMKPFLVTEDQERDYAIKAKLTLHLAKLFNVQLHQRHILELIVNQKANEIENQLEDKFNHLIKEELLNFSNYGIYQFLEKSSQRDEEIGVPLENYYKSNKNQIIQNASYPLTYFDENSCLISKEYIRYKTDGSLLPCCIFPQDFLTLQASFNHYWHHQKYRDFAYRTESFPTSKEHRNSPDFSFCHQCPHLDIHEDMAIQTKPKSK